VKLSSETIRDVIARCLETCATSNGKSVLVVWSIDREENFVPEYEGLRLHHDSLEFIDTDGTPTVLPFSRIARIEIDIEYTDPRLPPPEIKIEDGTGKVVRFRKKHRNQIVGL
jgi:hypothetical protein